ncbi:hypothetical protein D9M70_634270 [compost metagenome]
MVFLLKCARSPRWAAHCLAALGLAKAAHLLMVLSVRGYARGLLSQVEVRYLLRCSSALNRASLKLALAE